MATCPANAHIKNSVLALHPSIQYKSALPARHPLHQTNGSPFPQLLSRIWFARVNKSHIAQPGAH
jgi:hypothetical protein